MEQCERCGGPVHLEERTVVLSNDVRREIREHVYCCASCAIAPGTPATQALDAIAVARGHHDGPGNDGRSDVVTP
jgi:hypothetical protein